MAFEGDLHLQKIDIRKSTYNLNSSTHQFIIYKINHWLKYILYQSNYIISTLATALIQSETTSCDQEIFAAIYDLKKKRKLADIYIYIIYKEIIKTIDFKDTTKDDLQDRINILLINKTLINKINRNLNF